MSAAILLEESDVMDLGGGGETCMIEVHIQWGNSGGHHTKKVEISCENRQWLAPSRHLPLFVCHYTYHYDVSAYLDHGIKIRIAEGL
jgi:hypothetical protein